MSKLSLCAELKNSPLFRKLRHQIGKAVGDFNLIEEGDRIAVAVSGGKDSYTLLLLLEELRQRAPVSFELVAVNIDSGYPGYRTDVIEGFLQDSGFNYSMVPTEHYAIIQEKRRPGSSYCSICARLKRGSLYEAARTLGCNKLALGHHQDDFIETLLLNQFFVGSLKSMAASMLADNGVTTVIRPSGIRCRRGYHQLFATGRIAGGLLLLSGLRHGRPAAQADEAAAERAAGRYSPRQEQPAESALKRASAPSSRPVFAA